MQRLNKILTVIVILAGGLYYFAGTVRSTADMIEGRHVLHMDDWVTHDAVNKILGARDFKEFRFQVADGDEHRYGRVLFYYTALAAWIPEKIFGEKGVILATRLSLALAMFAGFVILTLIGPRTWYGRGLLLALLVTLPNTVYYINVPKPEPLIVFFLAVYLLYAVRNEFRFGPYWFFLGMAFGAKISVLPLIPLAIGLAVVRIESSRPRLEFQWKAGLKAIFFLILGHMVAVPMLFQGYYAKWYKWTFLATGHGQDSVNVNVFTWVDFFLRGWTAVPPYLFIAVFVLLAGCIAFGIARFYIPMFRGGAVRFPLDLVLIGLGLALTVPIALTVKRVWGFYLHVGAVLIYAGLVLLFENRFRFEIEDADSGATIMGKVSRGLALAAVLALAACLPFQFKSSMERFAVWSVRSERAEHRDKLRIYNDAIAYFRRAAGLKKWTLNVRYDPRLYPPGDTIAYSINYYFGPFLLWHTSPDIIVTYKDTVLGYPLPPRDNVEYSASVKARKLLARHTAPPGQKCAAHPCYRRVQANHPSMRVYTRSDLFDKHRELHRLK